MVVERSDTRSSELKFHLPSGIDVGSIHGPDAKPSAVIHRWGGAHAVNGPEWGQSSKPANSSRAAQPQRLTEPAGVSRCQVCHPSEVEEYARSEMAHSLRHASHEPDGKVETPDAKITAHSDAAGYWQQLASGGEANDYRIDYVIGSGNHASGYLLDVAGHLFQSPTAYYKSRQASMTWRRDMKGCPIRISPGPSVKHVCSAMREPR